MLALLREMRGRRLAMYVGEVSLSKLADFLRGFDYAIEKLGHGRDTLLEDFRKWIQQKKFATPQGWYPQSWETAILARSAGEAEAVAEFWKLLDEFLAQLGSDEQAARHSS
jgi:hypothetical protein